MERIHYPIDPFKPMEEQAKDIMKLLRPILPLKMEQLQVSVTIPAEHAARAYGAIKTVGTIRREEWRADGSWHGVVEMAAGSYAPFLDKLGNVTKGAGEAKIVG
jgi:ribosome maturation protein SDO1